jgi:hypothetical protein
MVTGKLAELWVDIVAHDKIAPAIAAAKEKLNLLSADLAKAGTGAWNDKIREYVAAQTKIAETSKQLQRSFDIAANGKIAVVFRDLKEGMGKFGEHIEAIGGRFPLMMAGLTGMAAAASPDVFKTLAMSFQYLTASIGLAFMPVIIEVIRWLQRAAQWVLGLDDETKAFIVTVAKWVLGLSALAFIFGRIFNVVSMLLPLFRALSAAMGFLFHLGPIGLALGAIAVGAAAVYFGGASAPLEGIAAGRRMAGLGPEHAGGTSPLTTAATAAMPIARGAHAAAASAGAAGAALPVGLRSALGTVRHAGRWTRVLPWLGGVSAFADAHEAIGIRREMDARPGGGGGALGMGVPVAHGGTAGSRMGAIRGAAAGGFAGGAPGSAGGPGILTASTHQSQFTSIEQQWQRLQQTAASGSSLEAEMARIAAESLRHLISVDTSTRITAGRPPPGLAP